MSITSEEIASQPALWRRAEEVARSAQGLPAPGERACLVGCGTSLYVAQAAAALREAAGHGVTDAFAASELPSRGDYDVVVAISRSGTTSEVVRALGRGVGARSVAITAVPGAPVAAAAEAVVALPFADEQSVVQTRFATTALALLRELADPGSAARAADAGE